MKELFGVTVAMTTPFNEDGNVDLDSIQEQAERLIRAGVDCLYPCGTTGEMSRLSLRERESIAEAVVAQANGRVNVFIHTGADNPDDTIRLSQHAARVGADGVGIVSPMFLHVSDAEMADFYLDIANALPRDFPVYLYNIPQCSGNDISPETARYVYEKAENVIGIKYSYLDMSRIVEYLCIDPSFRVMHGADKFFSSLLVLGCVGTVSGVAGVFPEPFVKVYSAFRAGDMREMMRWQQAAREICDILKCGTNMAYFKGGLTYRGMRGGLMRRPQQDLSEADAGKLFAQLDLYCDQYGIQSQLK